MIGDYLRMEAPNEFEGTCRLSDGTFEHRRFEGPRSAALQDWEAWCAEIREREEWIRAQERHDRAVTEGPEEPAPEEPGREPEKAPARLPGGALYVLTVDGKNVGLFLDADRAMQIADTLGGALGLPYDVSEIRFWEGEGE